MGAAVAHEENIRQRDERDLERERKKKEKQWMNSVPAHNYNPLQKCLYYIRSFSC